MSQETLDEVQSIADTIASSPLSQRSIGAIGDDFGDGLATCFPPARAERATTLVGIVATWAAKQAKPTLPAEPPPLPAERLPAPALAAQTTTTAPIATPSFLDSDKVDEEDDVRLYGPKRPWKAMLGTLVALGLIAGLSIAAWFWFDRADTDDSTVATADPTAEPVDEETIDVSPTAVPTLEPTPVPEPTAVLPSYWADTVPILNSGTAEIAASTYSVSPANRAVLTGHTAAITGMIISDDGRVLTSGADRRLVDWGADVTLANPDVLNVTAPLTVLERTADQRVLAGDSVGNVSILDLADVAEPQVLRIHSVAISALTELPDGRIAVASVDGDVDVFAIDVPDDRLTLSHPVEVTGVVGLDAGVIATVAVDGIVRLWPPDGQGEPGQITTLNAPITAVTLLANGQLAAASVDGDIHVFDAEAGAAVSVALPGHAGAVRSLFETALPDGTTVLASGGDDTTVRLWRIDELQEVRVLEGHGDIISDIDVLPDGRLVSTSGDGTGRVWDLTLPAGQGVIPPHNWNLAAMSAWNNDQFVSGSLDGSVVLGSTAVAAQPIAITTHTSPIVGVAVMQSGDIASLDANSLLRISEPTQSGSVLVELDLAAGATALGVRTLEGVDEIVSGHTDGTVRLHDLTEETLVVSAHGNGVNDVAPLSSGLIASAGQDMTVRIIDPEDPTAVRVFDLHTGPVDVVIEMPDGRIASAGADGIFVYSAEELAQDHIRLNGQRSRTISLVSLPGNRLISTGEDGRVRLWDLNTPDEEPSTLVDIPGIVNPHLIQADNGLFVAGAARGYVVFTLN